MFDFFHGHVFSASSGQIQSKDIILGIGIAIVKIVGFQAHIAPSTIFDYQNSTKYYKYRH